MCIEKCICVFIFDHSYCNLFIALRHLCWFCTVIHFTVADIYVIWRYIFLYLDSIFEIIIKHQEAVAGAGYLSLAPGTYSNTHCYTYSRPKCACPWKSTFILDYSSGCQSFNSSSRVSKLWNCDKPHDFIFQLLQKQLRFQVLSF